MQGIAIHGPRPRADVRSRLADLDQRTGRRTPHVETRSASALAYAARTAVDAINLLIRASDAADIVARHQRKQRP